MKDNKGITLIELVLVLALVSVVMYIAFSLTTFGIKSFSMQKEENDAMSSSRYAMDYITREIRSADTVEVSGNILTVDGSIIRLSDNNLMKDSKVLVKGIGSINFIKNGNKIIIRVNDEYSSTVYIRKGGNYET